MPSPQEALDQAFQDAVASIAHDIPLLMHGSGDVDPSQVDWNTAQLVAALTVEYMQKLTDAAINSHQMLRYNVPTSSPIPPPSFKRSRKPALPSQPLAPHPYTAAMAAAAAAERNTEAKTDPLETAEPLPAFKKKRRRATDDFWDEPLPFPKIKGVTSAEDDEDAADSAAADQAFVPVDPDLWVGVSGVDLLENRSRSAYVQGPAVIATQSFIFPICHDVYMYKRITDMLASKRSFMEKLVDPVITEMVRVEGKQELKKKKANKKEGGNTSDPEEDDGEASAEDDDNNREVPTWPGLDDILPIYRMPFLD